MKPVCPKCHSADIIISRDQTYAKCRYCDHIFKIDMPKSVINEDRIAELEEQRDRVENRRKVIGSQIENLENYFTRPNPVEVISFVLKIAIVWVVIYLALRHFNLEKIAHWLLIGGMVFVGGAVCYIIYWTISYPFAHMKLNKLERQQGNCLDEIIELDKELKKLK